MKPSNISALVTNPVQTSPAKTGLRSGGKHRGMPVLKPFAGLLMSALALSTTMSSAWAEAAAPKMALAGQQSAASPLGVWQGKWLGHIQIPGGPQLAAGLEVFERADGTPGANLISPDQGVAVMPIDSLTLGSDALQANAEMLGGELALRHVNGKLSGVLRQGGAELAMELAPVAAFPETPRPQHPQLPLPYAVEELRFRSQDGTALAGSLSLPKEAGKVPVVVLVAGSGPADRDATVAGHRPFAVLADHLTRQGVAVLRYDKRGVKQSAGSYADASLPNLVNDVRGAVAHLAADPRFSRVGLYGHSEGSAVVAAAARGNEQVAFVISAAGIGLPGIDAIVLQDDAELKLKGLSDAERAVITGYTRRFYQTLAAHDDVDARISALQALKTSLTESEAALVKQHTRGWPTVSMAEARKERIRALLRSHPAQDYAALNVPVLVLNGDKDVQVPAAENLAGLRQALAKNAHAKVEQLTGLNHMLQSAETGASHEYGQISETFAPQALQLISTFVRQAK